MKRGAAAFLAVAMTLGSAAVAAGGEQVARYRGMGDAIRLFDQFDNDGYSLAVSAGTAGSVELSVRVSDSPLASRAPFPTGLPRDRALPHAPERDAFAEKRANCVGLSELAVDLLRRAGIRARTVQGVLKSDPGTPGYDGRIGGAYHRWIEVHYPDRGFAFSDPSASVNGVDARYLPFSRRAYAKPKDLRLTAVSFAGTLGYGTLPSGLVSLRRRATTR